MLASIHVSHRTQAAQLIGLIQLLYPTTQITVDVKHTPKDIIVLEFTGGNSDVPELEIEVFLSKVAHIKSVLSMNIFNTVSGLKTDLVEVIEYI